MLLVFDVGNTNIVLGVYEKEILRYHWRISTDHSKTTDEYGILVNNLLSYRKIKQSDIEAVAISSVVPLFNTLLVAMSQRYFNIEPLVINTSLDTGLVIDIDNLQELGADILVSAAAGFEKFGGPLIVIDFGTATTYVAINKEGIFLGVSITPGILTANEALFQKTALLPRTVLTRPGRAIGKNTVESICSGLFYGVIGQTNEIVKRMKAEIGEEAKVIATGGFSNSISQESSIIDVVEPFLILEGLRIIYERNVSQYK